MTREEEIASVKLIGKMIGYGNMMSIASALWRRSLREAGYPESGAFYPTCPSFIQEEIFKECNCESEMLHQDRELDHIYGDINIGGS